MDRSLSLLRIKLCSTDRVLKIKCGSIWLRSSRCSSSILSLRARKRRCRIRTKANTMASTSSTAKAKIRMRCCRSISDCPLYWLASCWVLCFCSLRSRLSCNCATSFCCLLETLRSSALKASFRYSMALSALPMPSKLI